jgi:hypothetical protein
MADYVFEAMMTLIGVSFFAAAASASGGGSE